jgi:hypothetical protein
MGLSFTIAAGPRQRCYFGSESRGAHDNIYCFTLETPQLKGQVPVFISPRNKVDQLKPQALGSLFLASYDSQAYCRD